MFSTSLSNARFLSLFARLAVVPRPALVPWGFRARVCGGRAAIQKNQTMTQTNSTPPPATPATTTTVFSRFFAECCVPTDSLGIVLRFLILRLCCLKRSRTACQDYS